MRPLQQISEYYRLEQEKNQERERYERQLGRINQQLKESKRVNIQFQSINAEIEQLKLTWREGEKAPCKISSAYNECYC